MLTIGWQGLMGVQGCKLWSHPDGLADGPLPETLWGLVGKGCAGPPADIDGYELMVEQRARCLEGLDARQVAMLRAQVCCWPCLMLVYLPRVLRMPGPDVNTSGLVRALPGWRLSSLTALQRSIHGGSVGLLLQMHGC